MNSSHFLPFPRTRSSESSLSSSFWSRAFGGKRGFTRSPGGSVKRKGWKTMRMQASDALKALLILGVEWEVDGSVWSRQKKRGGVWKNAEISAREKKQEAHRALQYCACLTFSYMQTRSKSHWLDYNPFGGWWTFDQKTIELYWIIMNYW